MKVYKVVTPKYNSILVEDTPINVKYRIGIESVPPVFNTSLMAFNTTKYIRKFCKELRISDFRVLECECIRGGKFWVSGIIINTVLSLLNTEEFMPDRSLYIEAIKQILDENQWPFKDVVGSFGSPPKGTVFCSSITPIREIK